MSREDYESDEEWFEEHVQSYEGALIENNVDGEPWFYFLIENSGDGVVVYVSGSVGPVKEYTYVELQKEIQNGTIVLATNHQDEEVFETPDGTMPY